MGSFNIKCNFTDFSILYGDRMVLFPIIKNIGYGKIKIKGYKGVIEEVNSDFESTCYHSAFWKSYNLPLFGTYDDYGLMKLDLDDANIKRLKVLIRVIERSCYDTLAGENQYHDIAFENEKIQSLSKEEKWEELWNYLQEICRENRLFLNNISPVNFNFMAVSQYAYDYYANKLLYKRYLEDGNLKSKLIDIDEDIEDAILKISEESKVDNFTLDLNSIPSKLRIDCSDIYGINVFWYYLKIFFTDIYKKYSLDNLELLKLKALIKQFYLSAKVLSGLNSIEKHAKPVSYASQDWEVCEEITDLLTSIKSKRYLDYVRENYFGDDEFQDTINEYLMV